MSSAYQITQVARNKPQQVVWSLFPRLVHNCLDQNPALMERGGIRVSSAVWIWHVKPSSSRHWQNTWKKWTSSSRAWSLRFLKFSRVSSRILLHSQDTSAADHSNPPKAIKLCSLQLIKDYAPLLLEHRRAYILEHKSAPSRAQKCTYLNTKIHLQERNPSQRLILPAILIAFCIIGALAGFLGIKIVSKHWIILRPKF